jgi:Beta-propeller repeat
LIIDPVLMFSYSTYLGGTGQDTGVSIAVDAVGQAYVTGSTFSFDFPTTPGAFDTTYNGEGDAFITKLDAAGSVLVYSTYLGPSTTRGYGIALDAARNVYVTGHTFDAHTLPTTPGALDQTYNGGDGDAFISKISEMAQ